MSKAVKLTPGMLRKIVLEEKSKIEDEMNESEKLVKEPKEVEADEYAGTLEKEIDFMKALKIKEGKARDALARIQEAQKNSKARIVKMMKD